MHLWCPHTGVTDYLCRKYVQQSCIFFFLSSTPHIEPIHFSRMYERENGKVFTILLNVCVRLSASGLRRSLLWCSRVCRGVSFLPVLVTWLLPVAGTTYKPAVIKVFDLLCLPVETHVSRPANTVLLPPWSMTDREARATNWQCRDWTRGRGGMAREGGRVERRGRGSSLRGRVNGTGVKWKHAWWNKLRKETGFILGCQFGGEKTSESHYLSLQSSHHKRLHFPSHSPNKRMNSFLLYHLFSNTNQLSW